MGVKNSYAVIMAGGIGSRFWPKSRESKPKQYLALVEDGSLIQNTAARLKGMFDDKQIYIVSTKPQQPLLQEQLAWLPQDQIFFEPMGRNTAPAIGLAAIHLQHKDPQAVMVLLPADHRITKTNTFLQKLQTALNVVQKDKQALVTIGIQPTYAATGYGYLETSDVVDGSDYNRVKRFREKPDRDTAEQFIRQGNFFWNSGIFIWRASTILEQFRQFMPQLHDGLLRIQKTIATKYYEKTLADVYAQLNSESIDYGVMEHASSVFMVHGDFGWSDVGSWEEVYNISKKDENNNVVKGQALLKEVKNSYIQAGNRTVSIIGLNDVIVIDEADALLICKRDHSQDVRWVVSKLDQNRDGKSH